jgi:hypothetical protein
MTLLHGIGAFSACFRLSSRRKSLQRREILQKLQFAKTCRNLKKPAVFARQK